VRADVYQMQVRPRVYHLALRACKKVGSDGLQLYGFDRYGKTWMELEAPAAAVLLRASLASGGASPRAVVTRLLLGENALHIAVSGSKMPAPKSSTDVRRPPKIAGHALLLVADVEEHGISCTQFCNLLLFLFCPP
jgi:hypothetical protein